MGLNVLSAAGYKTLRAMIPSHSSGFSTMPVRRHDSKTRKFLRFYGGRELAAGFGTLSSSNPSGWLWARVAGDVLDISSLCKAMIANDNDRGKGIATAPALVGRTLADVYCAKQLSSGIDNPQSRTAATNSIMAWIIIARDRNQIYGFRHDFTRLPEIFKRNAASA